MDRETFAQILGPLAVQFGGLDAAQWATYFRALSDVPPRWLDAAVTAALRQDRAFMPKAGELRALADGALSAAQAQLTPGDCGTCDNTRWVEAPDNRGVKRAAHCGCWHAWRDDVARLGQVAPAVPQIAAGQFERGEFDPRMAAAGEDR
jgi:hypothetical protein